jgi:hypothetical protein
LEKKKIFPDYLIFFVDISFICVYTVSHQRNGAMLLTLLDMKGGGTEKRYSRVGVLCMGLIYQRTTKESISF